MSTVIWNLTLGKNYEAYMNSKPDDLLVSPYPEDDKYPSESLYPMEDTE